MVTDPARIGFPMTQSDCRNSVAAYRGGGTILIIACDGDPGPIGDAHFRENLTGGV